MPAGRPKTLTPTEGIEEVTTEEKKRQLWLAYCSGLILGQQPDLDDWADDHVVLPSETSSEHGRWKTSRTPYLRRIMKCLSPSSIAKQVVAMKGFQLGFTTVALIMMAYNPDCNPGPLSYVQKTDDAVKFFSNQKLKAFIKSCDKIYDTLGAGKPKEYSNSYNMKSYPGGFNSLGPATVTYLKSQTIRDMILDEEDTYDLNVGKEGSPGSLGAKRMKTYPNRKLFRLSTPVLEELSTIAPAYEAGSQEHYYVSCPHCNPTGSEEGFRFWIEWDHIKYSKTVDERTGLPIDVWCECPNCAGKIDENKHKTWMMSWENADWYSEKGSPGKKYKVGDVENVSFHISSLYSPVGFYSWRDAVEEWFEYLATRRVDLLQVHINQVQAKTFSMLGGDIDHTALYKRRESYAGNLGDWRVPDGALCLTAGVDIQDDRIEVVVRGWGLLDENWYIDYAVLLGDTAMMGDRNMLLPNGTPTVWRLLDEYLAKVWRHQCGVEMPIEATMIDCGHKTDEVHTFCRTREHRRIFPVRGQYGWGKGFWTRAKRRHERFWTIPFEARVDELKSKLYSQLMIDDPGPGYCHFPKLAAYDEPWFRGLTCETRKTKMVGGRKKLYWDKPSGARNEPIDVSNYSYVALLAYAPDLTVRATQGLKQRFAPRGTSSGIKRRRKKGHPGL